jgi:hypothetical protein
MLRRLDNGSPPILHFNPVADNARRPPNKSLQLTYLPTLRYGKSAAERER